jgi:hypothetical protein
MMEELQEGIAIQKRKDSSQKKVTLMVRYYLEDGEVIRIQLGNTSYLSL